MRSLALTLATVLLFPLSAFGGQTQHDAIDDAIFAALDAREAGVGYQEAKDELYAIVSDPYTSVACKRYADLALIGFVLIDTKEAYLQSEATDLLFEWVMEASIVQENDCLLAP